jgi:hypothetical protein
MPAANHQKISIKQKLKIMAARRALRAASRCAEQWHQQPEISWQRNGGWQSWRISAVVAKWRRRNGVSWHQRNHQLSLAIKSAA